MDPPLLICPNVSNRDCRPGLARTTAETRYLPGDHSADRLRVCAGLSVSRPPWPPISRAREQDTARRRLVAYAHSPEAGHQPSIRLAPPIILRVLYSPHQSLMAPPLQGLEQAASGSAGSATARSEFDNSGSALGQVVAASSYKEDAESCAVQCEDSKARQSIQRETLKRRSHRLQLTHRITCVRSEGIATAVGVQQRVHRR